MGSVSSGHKAGTRTTEFWVAQMTSAILAIVPMLNAAFGWNIAIDAEVFYAGAAGVQAVYIASRTVLKAFADGIDGKVATAESDRSVASDALKVELARLEQRRLELEAMRLRMEAASTAVPAGDGAAPKEGGA